MKSSQTITAILCGLTIGATGTFGQARLTRDDVPPWPPANGTAHFILDPDPESQATSLQQLYNLSDIVVDAVVQSVRPARLIPSRRLETDIIVLVNRVFKGPATTRRVALTQRGGTVGAYQEITDAYALMKRGEHYLFFAIADPRRSIAPVAGAADLPRYLIEGEWVGLFHVDASGDMHLSPGAPAPLHNQFDGAAELNVTTALSALASAH